MAANPPPLATAFAALAPDAGPGLAWRALLVAALLVVASTVWWFARRWTSRFRPVHARPGRTTLTNADLGVELGARATFVQFSAATCSTCPQVHRLLADLAADHPGVAHVELAAENHMDLVRRFDVFRTPTVLLLDPDGRVHSRTSGPLTRGHALAGLHQLIHDAPRSIDA